MKKVSTVFFCIVLMLSVTSYAEIKNPDTFIKATYGTVPTLDPATNYNTTGAQRVENVYEMLIRRDGSYTDRFVPNLATEVPSLENGLISEDGLTYTFPIRKGVKFHEGGDLIAPFSGHLKTSTRMVRRMSWNTSWANSCAPRPCTLNPFWIPC